MKRSVRVYGIRVATVASVSFLAVVAFCGLAQAVYVPPSGNTLWLKADSITGVSDGGSVALWADSSGSGHNFVQYDSIISQPTYIASGLNGNAVLRFNGSTQAFYEDEAQTWRPSLSGLTIFAVVKNTAGGSGTQAWFGNGDGKVAFGANVSGGYDPTSSFTAWTPNAASTYGSAGSLNTSWNIQAYTMSDAIQSNWSWYYNGDKRGQAYLTTGIPADYDSSRLWVGYSGNYPEVWKGDIAEILTFDHVLTALDRSSVTSYLQQKYGTPQWRTPTAVPLSSGIPYGGDPTYAASKAIDGNPDTFSCLLDDTLTGTNPGTVPAYAGAPTTGHMLFDLGADYRVDGAKLFSRNAPAELNPASVEFYLSDASGNHLSLLKSYTFSALLSGAAESLYWDPVVARYIDMQVLSSYEQGNHDGVNFNYQIGEMQFSAAVVPEPSTVVLLATGLIGLLAYAWRKRR